jgi:predicted glutamine amidotransferase
LNVRRHGDGWGVALYKADGLVADPLQSRMDFADRDAAVAEAKLAIDNFFRSMSLCEKWPD